MLGRTVSIAFVRPLVAALGDAAGRLGLSGEVLADVDARIPVELYLRLWREAPVVSGDDDFGLHLGQAIPIGAYDVLDYILRSSETVRAAIDKTIRYFRIMSDASEPELVIEGTVARIRHRLVSDGQPAPRHANEFVLSLLVARWRSAMGTAWPLHGVAFCHARPERTEPHREVFGADVFFDRDYNELAFDAALLAAPIATADAALNALLGRHAERLLRESPQADTFARRARLAAAEAASRGEFSVGWLAKRLAMSPRTLQRKLRDENLAPEELIDDVRRDLALRYLEERRLATAEVAALVGFHDASAFYRAFKRWTGTTPKRYLSDGAGPRSA
jgi:AraC-like DNA-binding protein